MPTPHVAQGSNVIDLGRSDPLFARIRAEAEEVVRREPEICGFIFSCVLNHNTLEGAVVHRLADRLDHQEVSGDLIRQTYRDIMARDPSIGEAFRADIVAVLDRDPATSRLIEPLLYYKGFHALQTHRLAHALWKAGRKDFAPVSYTHLDVYKRQAFM